MRQAALGRLLAPLLALLLAPAAASPLGLSYALTDDVQVVHADPTLAPHLPHVLATFHNALAWQRRVFGWTPADRTTLWLRDFADLGNAGVSPIPRNFMRLEVSPLGNPFETAPSAERIYSTMNHELVHLATTDQANTRDRFWRRVFLGKVAPAAEHPESLLYTLLTTPRWAVPRWYLEGSAVFLETWMGGGLGRAQGGYDEMVFRAMVRDDAPFLDPLALAARGTRSDFQGGANAYLYGTRFFTWLAGAHSPDAVLRWLRRDDDSRAHYADQFEQVFGEPLDAAWQRWIADERRFQQANLAALREHPSTPRRPLAAQALGSVSRAFVDEARGELIAAVRTPGVVDQVVAIDLRSGATRPLAEVTGALLYDVSSLAWDAAGQTVLFTTENLGLRSLHAVEADTGRRTELLPEARIGAIAVDPASRALLGVRHEAGIATLVQVPFPYRDWQPLHSFPFGVVLRDLDVSPDGSRLAAAVTDTRGDQFVRVWSLAALREGRAEPLAEFRFGAAAPEGLVFAPDGQSLYGSAYVTGVSNIFRLDLTTRRAEMVTNAETGFFRPIPRPDGTLVALEYTGEGFLPVQVEPRPAGALGTIRFLGTEVAKRHPIVTGWQVPAARTIEADRLVRERGPYEPLAQMELLHAYPVLTGYREARGLGWHVAWGDPLGLASASITAAVTPGQDLSRDERSHLQISGRYLGWNASLAWNRASFYDLFGPTLRGQRGVAASVGYDDVLLRTGTRRLESRSRLAGYAGLTTLPGAQNVATGDDRLVTAETGIYWQDLRRSLGAVEDEKGVVASAAVALGRSAGRVVTQPLLRLDAGLPLAGWPHASVWSRSAAGGTAGTRDLAISRHYFGAFGNNRVDDGPVQRYREPGSLPGFEIDAVSARSFVRQTLELNLPRVVFGAVGVPELHLQSLRSSVFATGLWTEPFGGARRRYASVGAQADLRFAVLHWYDTTLSFGWAAGFDGGRRAGSEWMVSLKLL
ncbi:MAG: hypothetical protein QM722_23345 [Piscinibacter sp.]